MNIVNITKTVMKWFHNFIVWGILFTVELFCTRIAWIIYHMLVKIMIFRNILFFKPTSLDMFNFYVFSGTFDRGQFFSWKVEYIMLHDIHIYVGYNCLYPVSQRWSKSYAPECACSVTKAMPKHRSLPLGQMFETKQAHPCRFGILFFIFPYL
jgi:hypothetical protein